MFSGTGTIKIIILKQQGMAAARFGGESRADSSLRSINKLMPVPLLLSLPGTNYLNKLYLFSLSELLGESFLLSFWSKSRSVNGKYIHQILIFMLRKLFYGPGDLNRPTVVRKVLLTVSEDMKMQPFTCLSYLQCVLCKPVLTALYSLSFLHFPK